MRHRRIDYHFSPYKEGVSSVAFTPRSSPGALIVAIASKAREALGGVVASRLALEHFSEGALEGWSDSDGPKSLEEGFRNANRAVFDFGARLSAGGRLAASLIAVAVDRNEIALARAGRGGAYLFREGQIFPFFEEEVLAHPDDPVLGIYVGAQPKITVQTSAIPCGSRDTVLLLSRTLSSDEIERIEDALDLAGNKQEAYLRKLITQFEFGMSFTIVSDVVYLSVPVVE